MSWINFWQFEVLLMCCIILIIFFGSFFFKTFVSSYNLKIFFNYLLLPLFFNFLFYIIYYNILFSKSVNYFYYDYFHTNVFTQASKMFVLFTVIIIFFLLKDYVRHHKYNIWEFPIILLFVLFFGYLLLSSFNIFASFISLEGLSFGLYVAAAYNFTKRSSTEAAIKYLVLGTLSSGLLLFGITSLYAYTCSLNGFHLLFVTVQDTHVIIWKLGSFLFFISFIFKLGGWPYHQWLPDVYQGAPTITTAFFSITVKVIIFLTVVKLFKYITLEKSVLSIICLMSLISGIFGAVKTPKVKRFLAYTSINQTGFLLIGILLNATGFIVLYFVLYISATLLLFIIILKTTNIYTQSKVKELTFIFDFSNFTVFNFNKMSYLLISLFSMAGLPPFSMALIKWYILFALAVNNYFILLFCVVFLTIFSIYYYIKLIKNIFFEDVELYTYFKILSLTRMEKYLNIFKCFLPTFLNMVLFFLSFLLVFGIVCIYADFEILLTFLRASTLCHLTFSIKCLFF